MTRTWLHGRRLDFKEIGQLGQGNFSKVLRARHRINGQEYAVKRTTRELTPDNPAFIQFIQVWSEQEERRHSLGKER